MSLDTGESFRSVMNKILLRPIGRAMANPVALALLITSVIMIIIRFTYDDDHIFRTALRVFGICTMFLFINNHILINDQHSRQLNPDQQNVIRNLERGPRYTRAEEDDSPMVVTRSADSSTFGGISSGSDVLERLPDARSVIVPHQYT